MSPSSEPVSQIFAPGFITSGAQTTPTTNPPNKDLFPKFRQICIEKV